MSPEFDMFIVMGNILGMRLLYFASIDGDIVNHITEHLINKRLQA